MAEIDAHINLESVFQAAIEDVAQEMDVTPEHVRQIVASAIVHGFFSPDPVVRHIWRTIPRSGEIPTIEETVLHIAGLMH